MNVFNRTGLYAGLTGLVLVSAAAVPAVAQTKTFPPGTDCSQLTGADVTACQHQMSSQQRGGAGDTGAAPGAQTAPGNIGNGVQNPANGGVNNDSTIGPSGGVPNTGGTNSSNGNSNGTSNP
jgi:hypothetical protein